MAFGIDLLYNLKKIKIMESKKLLLGVVLISLGFTSCKDEREAHAEKAVESYVVYVDSIEKVSAENAAADWDKIDAGYQLKMN